MRLLAMAQTTEAACLLQSGAMYPRRIGFKTTTGIDIFAGVKPGGVSIYFGDAPIYHFDLEGRWQRAFVDNVHYLKGLDATVQSIDRDREGDSMVLRRQTLPFGRAVDLDASIRSVALELIDDLDSGRLLVLDIPDKARQFAREEFRTFLERVSGWDPAAWFAHRERYLGTYGPSPFLPPDCPNALMLQATLGNPNGRAFGRSKPAEHYVRSLAEFEEHARAVAGLMGLRIGQAKGIFLAGAEVLHRPIDQVQGYLEIIRRVLPNGSKSGDAWDDCPVDLGVIHAFLDDFAGPLPTPEGWKALQTLNLRRVTLGIESGSERVLSLFGKTWQGENLRTVVADIRAADIGIGLVVLVGSGGQMAAEDHLQQTTALLDSLELDSSVLMTLVDARSLDQTLGDSVAPCTDAEIAAQVAALKSRWVKSGHSKGPKVIVYNPDKQMR